MSLYKAIKSGKEHRKQYEGAKRYDPMCRNHGGCVWCLKNRLYRNRKSKEKADYSEKETEYDSHK